MKKLLLITFLMASTAITSFAWNDFGQTETNDPVGQPLPGVLVALAIGGVGALLGKKLKDKIKK